MGEGGRGVVRGDGDGDGGRGGLDLDFGYAICNLLTSSNTICVPRDSDDVWLYVGESSSIGNFEE